MSYRASESLHGLDSNVPTADVWGVGCIFAEMVRREELFADSGEILTLCSVFRSSKESFHSVIVQLCHCRGKVNLSDGLDLLSKMLHPAAASRITVSEALRHSYLNYLHSAA